MRVSEERRTRQRRRGRKEKKKIKRQNKLKSKLHSHLLQARIYNVLQCRIKDCKWIQQSQRLPTKPKKRRQKIKPAAATVYMYKVVIKQIKKIKSIKKFNL